MPAKVVEERHVEYSYEFRREYRWKEDPQAGFSFPCDKDGHVHGFAHREAHENYALAEQAVADGRMTVAVEMSERKRAHPAIAECVKCGRRVHLLEFTNTCVCGRDYGMSGELLAPRSQWGWETGESLGEILAIGHHQETEDPDPVVSKCCPECERPTQFGELCVRCARGDC